MRILLISVVALSIAVAAFFLIRRQKMTTAGIARAEIGVVIDAAYGIGTVKAQRTFSLKLGVISTIEYMKIREGDVVRQGELLVRLSGDNVFRAPFSGTITALPFKQGESVFPQVTILTLTDLKDLYLAVSMDQEAVVKVRQGQRAFIRFDILKDQRFEGVVRTVFSNEGQFWVHVDPSEPLPSSILPGMTADVAIEFGRREKALLVPLAALSEGVVRIRRNGRVSAQKVVPGSVMGDRIEIKSGDIREGDEVLLKMYKP